MSIRSSAPVPATTVLRFDADVTRRSPRAGLPGPGRGRCGRALRGWPRALRVRPVEVLVRIQLHQPVDGQADLRREHVQRLDRHVLLEVFEVRAEQFPQVQRTNALRPTARASVNLNRVSVPGGAFRRRARGR